MLELDPPQSRRSGLASGGGCPAGNPGVLLWQRNKWYKTAFKVDDGTRGPAPSGVLRSDYDWQRFLCGLLCICRIAQIAGRLPDRHFAARPAQRLSDRPVARTNIRHKRWLPCLGM